MGLNDVEGRKAEFNRFYQGGPSLAQLLHGFFLFYSDFAFDQKCLCPVSGTSQPKVRSWRHSSVMDIINPLEPGGNWLSQCQKIPSFLHQHICLASCLFSTWDRVTKHYNHNRKKRTFV